MGFFYQQLKKKNFLDPQTKKQPRVPHLTYYVLKFDVKVCCEVGIILPLVIDQETRYAHRISYGLQNQVNRYIRLKLLLEEIEKQFTIFS